MWDLVKRFSLGRISKRSSTIFATIILVASLAFSLLPTPIQAQAGNATWQGESISYANKQFIKTNPSGLPSPLGSAVAVYMAVEQPAPGAPNSVQKAHFIYFAPGADPPNAPSANYITFDYSGGNYTNGTTAATITLTPQTGAGGTGGSSGTTSQGVTSCAYAGIGWIVCPVTNFLAGAMDWMFEILSTFLTVRPVQTTADNALFRLWNVMRNFANIVFVIAFLIVIYSQVTGMGISSYGIKKILPRLIVVAILVNVSYWICAVAVDISNISGNSIQQLFITLRNTMVGSEGNNWEWLSWESIAGFVLSGGTAAIVGGIAAHALLGSTVTGALYMLLPTLVLVITSVLVALLIMALRQALITVLIIASPLVIVAYLLPNTEKYGEKGVNIFMTMLAMFPILSVVFGGAQLAGTAIIQNADSINLIILGMAVQVAPVIVTPLLIRFSGALLSRVAGFVNNPNKGLIDRTRNWARERADQQKSKVLGMQAPSGIRGFTTRRSQSIDAKRRDREGTKKMYDTYADARWANDRRSHAIHEGIEQATMRKDRGEAMAQATANRLKTTKGHQMQIDDTALRAAKLDVDVSKAQGDVQFENMRAEFSAKNPAPADKRLGQTALYAQRLTQESMVAARQLHGAQHEQQQNFADALKANTALQQQAGGISEHGADAALAAAITTTRQAYNKSVEEAAQVVKHFNLSSEQRQALALGQTIRATDASGVDRSFTAQDIFAREAVIEQQIKTGTVKEAQQLVELSGIGAPLEAFRTTIYAAVAESNLPAKTIYLGGATINEIGKGTIASPADLVGRIQDTIAKGKVSADKLVDADKDAVLNILNAAKNPDTSKMREDPAAYQAAIQELKKAAEFALNNDRLMGRTAANVKPLLEQMTNL